MHVIINGGKIMQVFVRLQKLCLSMSHKRVTSMIDDLGKDHDQEVLKWRDGLDTVQV